MIRALLAASFALGTIPIANAAASPVFAGDSSYCIGAPTYTRGKATIKLSKKPDRVLVFDASPSEESAATANRIFLLDPCTQSKIVSDLWILLESQFDSTPTKSAPCKADFLREFLFLHANMLAELSSNRWISEKGQRLDVYAVHLMDAVDTISFSEATRQSRIARDITTLVKLAGKIGVTVSAFGACRFRVTERSYTLGKQLADLKVSVDVVAASDTTPNRRTRAGASADPGPEKLETTIVTGPAEHFFLSANAGFTKATQVSYDETTRTLGPAEKPTGFYIGANYAIDDLYTEAEDSNFAKRFLFGMYFGAFVQASKRPFEQLGALVGFRRNLTRGFETYLPFDTVSPFVGVVWVQNDTLAGSVLAAAISSRYGKAKLIMGLSLNLDKALGWVDSEN